MHPSQAQSLPFVLSFVGVASGEWVLRQTVAQAATRDVS
jgi:hypothetical protein